MSELVELTIPAKHHYTEVVRACLQAFLEQIPGMAGTDAFHFVLFVVHEACTNVIQYAHDKALKEATVTVKTVVDEQTSQLVIELRDGGHSLDPLLADWPPPSSWQKETHNHQIAYRLLSMPEPDPLWETGRGLYFIAQVFDEVLYLPEDGNNRWIMMKELDLIAASESGKTILWS